MLKVLIPELTGAPHHSYPCLPSQGFPFFDLFFLADLLKVFPKCLVWMQALAADGSRTGGTRVAVPRTGVKIAHRAAWARVLAMGSGGCWGLPGEVRQRCLSSAQKGAILETGWGQRLLCR